VGKAAPSFLRVCYRALLLVLPADDRSALGADMEAVFVCAFAEYTRRHGRLGAIAALGRSAGDLLAFAVRARRDARERRPLDVLQLGRKPEKRMNTIGRFLTTTAQDARFAAQLLIKDRSFAITSLATLAVCISANAVVFSIVWSVVLKPLPIPHGDRIVMFSNNYPNLGAIKGSTAVPDYFDRRQQTDVFTELALYRRQGATLGGKDGARRLVTVRATPSFFRLTSAATTLGRVFNEDEGQEGQDREALLSYAIWQSAFGGNQDVVGKNLHLSGTSYRIVGVASKDFRYLWNDVDVYLPASFTADEKSDNKRHVNNWDMIAMLKPGVPLARAQAEVDAINQHNDGRFPQFRKILRDAGFYTAVISLQSEVIEDVRPVLLLLWGGVLFVLLIGCLNIANLVLVRSSGRGREMATRHAIGADLKRLARQLLTEGMLLSIVGGGVGLFLAWWALRLIQVLGLDEMPRGHEIALDPQSVAVILGIALVVGLFIGLMPVARLGNLNVNSALREESRGGTASRRANFVRRGLATAQVTIAFVLLIGAGLLVASFRQVLRIDPGFAPQGIVTGAITLPSALYKDDAVLPFVDRMLEAVRAIPGVESAGVTSMLPMAGDHNTSVLLAEGYHMKDGESLVSPDNVMVSDGYFDTMKTPLMRGRYLTRRDIKGSPMSVVVDDRLANHFWPGQDPIGRRLYEPSSPDNIFKTGPNTTWLTVVGVVKEVQFDGLATSATRVGACYFSFAQRPFNSMVVTVRSASGGDAIVANVRKAIASVDPTLPLYAVRTMDQYVDQALMPRRTPMLLATAFAIVALFLSAIGIYGVLACGVAQRRREIGIRLALGSTTGEIFTLVLADGVRIVAIGLGLGFGGLLALRHVLLTVLYRVTPMDPVVIATVATALAAVALLATFIPARRAAGVSPSIALTD
jgi:predicted permease